eukprot:1304467-Alexandrium_andersonii.AAC.1
MFGRVTVASNSCLHLCNPSFFRADAGNPSLLDAAQANKKEVAWGAAGALLRCCWGAAFGVLPGLPG